MKLTDWNTPNFQQKAIRRCDFDGELSAYSVGMLVYKMCINVDSKYYRAYTIIISLRRCRMTQVFVCSRFRISCRHCFNLFLGILLWSSTDVSFILLRLWLLFWLDSLVFINLKISSRSSMSSSIAEECLLVNRYLDLDFDSIIT